MGSKHKNKGDNNLALISLIMGAISIFYSVFTGIPAIVLGIIALRRKLGNPNQAKIGIALGVFGSLLIIPVIIIAFLLLKQPINEQSSIENSDVNNIQTIKNSLDRYKKLNGSYPECKESSSYCEEWTEFYNNLNLGKTYIVEFEGNSYNIQDRNPGTLIYAYNTSCFINTPADPASFKEEYEPKPKPGDNVALVYFHENGRACYEVND